MAHGDYECCARCDSKMSYSSFAEAKDEVCGGCAVDLFQLTGWRITTADELIAYIEDEDNSPDDVKRLGIDPCFYSNPVDDAVAARGIEVSR